jgi:hypothetical protein
MCLVLHTAMARHVDQFYPGAFLGGREDRELKPEQPAWKASKGGVNECELLHLAKSNRHCWNSLFFAECLEHSANATLNSTKDLPSVALGKGQSAYTIQAKQSLLSFVSRAGTLQRHLREPNGATRQKKAKGVLNMI